MQRQLIEMQVGEFWRNQVHFAADVVESVLCGHRETGAVSQSRVIESSFSVHFEVGDKSIPMGHRTPACPGMEIDSCQAESWRNQCRGRFVTVEGLSVHEEFSIEFSRSPTCEHRADGGFIHFQQLGYAAEVRGKIDDRTYIEITICPAVQTMTDSWSQRIVDGGMADSTLDTHRFQIAGTVEEPGKAHDRVQLQQCDGTAGSLRLTFPAFRDLMRDCGRASWSTFNPTARAVSGSTPGPTPPRFCPSIAL